MLFLVYTKFQNEIPTLAQLDYVSFTRSYVIKPSWQLSTSKYNFSIFLYLLRPFEVWHSHICLVTGSLVR